MQYDGASESRRDTLWPSISGILEEVISLRAYYWKYNISVLLLALLLAMIAGPIGEMLIKADFKMAPPNYGFIPYYVSPSTTTTTQNQSVFFQFFPYGRFFLATPI